MKNRSPEVDAYIEKSADHAQPILKKIRDLYHKACPEIEETIKWGFPHFEYDGLVGNVASFKEHVALGFWEGLALSDPENILEQLGKTGMASAKFPTAADVPTDAILSAYIEEALDLNVQGVKPVRSAQKRARPKELKLPADFGTALKKSKKGLKTFEGFSLTNRKEYIEWVTEAKRDETRKRRIATSVEWLSEGKPRNWKYMKEWRKA